ncbi:MAG: Gfo/Idh/MocA family oxidoreductase, partial [Desulfobacterales bacterium]|nr:Gfo/Idh/MocA family oxidoreductase [Desulfobacterales bacterium]
ARMKDVDLVGVVDIDRSQSEEIAKKLSTEAYDRYEQLFGKVDAVSIVVPTSDHFIVSRDFLEQDVDVLIEKPMTTTVEDADRLIEIAESRGLIIQVGHLERFNPAVVAVRDFIKKPMFIESHRLSLYKPRGTDVSVVLDLMIHDIDLILNFVRSEVKTVSAAGICVISAHVDIANARLEFKNGCVANVTASRISTRNERKIRLFQKEGYVSVDFAGREITVIGKNGDVSNSPVPGMGVTRMCFTQGDALDDELKSFVECVQKRHVPEVNGPVGRDALKTALSIMEQIRKTNRIYSNG